MKIIELNKQKYEVVENDNCLDIELLKEKLTDYFDNFDYIFGDYSYDKLRLKGFNSQANKKATSINNINNLEEYKKEYCSYGTKTFLLKKVQ